MNKVEEWKAEKHGFDVWPDVLRYAEAATPMKQIDNADLERMKWHGLFYRKRDNPPSYMMRIRLTGCELTSQQAKEIAYIAYQLGYGIIDVTTRANIQVQGLTIDKLPTAVTRLEACGLTSRQTGHDNIRNVFGHPLSGLDPEELIDTRQLCHEVAAIFVGSREYSDLPRKMNIAMSGARHHAIEYWTQDISFLACRTSDGKTAFRLLIAGTQGQNPHLPWHVPVLVYPHQVCDVTRAILDLFREQGAGAKRDQARLRYLLERIGVSGVLEFFDQRIDYPLQPCPSEPQPPSGYEDLIGWFPQKQSGLWAMGLSAPLGRMSWQQLEGLAILAKRWGDGTLRTTCQQGMLITNIPTGFKEAAATAAAALGLSVYGDTLARNTVACTGKQFCNIAVTETKGHMLQLVDKLRQRALTLHGIRIHMSGCPSSCAGHFTADIGLKGVRVRRLLGTREGFDVYLGGGIAGQVHMGIPYRLGIDVDQLPQLIEEVTNEYYAKHTAGQTFSAYWREKLHESEAGKVRDDDYSPPTWVCEGCEYRHVGEDPPVFCPSCAGLRRLFARLEDVATNEHSSEGDSTEAAPAEIRSDGFVRVAAAADVPESEGFAVDVAGMQIGLFRVHGEIVAIDDACPHEGAPLSQGTVDGNVVTCPWHSWTFNACTGCSIEPAGNEVGRYDVKLEDGEVLVKAGSPASAGARGRSAAPVAKKLPTPKTVKLTLAQIIDETPDTKTFRFDNSAGVAPPHLPGQFAQVRLESDGGMVSRSFTISSPPTRTKTIDLTIKRNPGGSVSNYLHAQARPGDTLQLKLPMGGYFFDQECHLEPLVLVSAGSGITPMMSILRSLCDTNQSRPCTFVYGARSEADIIFASECAQIADSHAWLTYYVQLSQPSDGWQGPAGRVEFSCIRQLVPDVAAARYFLCGPGEFMEAIQDALTESGVAKDRIHTEQFHAAAAPAVV